MSPYEVALRAEEKMMERFVPSGSVCWSMLSDARRPDDSIRGSSAARHFTFRRDREEEESRPTTRDIVYFSLRPSFPSSLLQCEQGPASGKLAGPRHRCTQTTRLGKENQLAASAVPRRRERSIGCAGRFHMKPAGARPKFAAEVLTASGSITAPGTARSPDGWRRGSIHPHESWRYRRSPPCRRRTCRSTGCCQAC